jgi:hypothetical protein
MNNHLISSSHAPPAGHDRLYHFWERSQGLWLSKLAKVTLRFLEEQELQSFPPIEGLSIPAFGIKMAWEYQTKPDSGQMLWCVDADQASLIFANQGIMANSFPISYQYQMLDSCALVTTNGDAEERTALEGNSRRVRELRTGGKLVKRIWENRFSA